ncbi:Actin regulatory protein CAP-G [Intoshia linei]|uniref:Actin regulatory protein CAP-G n=1 Tax=Intoshia linei TaxID=1819745 RepID=A0A177AVS2_9BILA|nr:Actin regulatory protein CAP-G [Intoshia linei]
MYGTFYNGDSYIVLNGFKDKGSNLIEYDIHFWIGRQSSQDEYGTAAYKTVELDNFLNDLPVQHREVQGHESELFLSYFKHLTILEGGTDSGFYHVTPEQYESRLLHFSGKGKNIIISEIPKCHKLIRHDDVYILDKGKEFIQWNGIDSNKDEIAKAMMYIVQAKSDRHAKSSVIDDSNTNNKEFFSELNDDLNDNDKEEVINQEMNQKVLYRISDRSGAIKIEQTQSGDDVSEGSIDEDDVFILEKTYSLYVIKGCNATIKEKQMGLYYAQYSSNSIYLILHFDGSYKICYLEIFENKCESIKKYYVIGYKLTKFKKIKMLVLGVGTGLWVLFFFWTIAVTLCLSLNSTNSKVWLIGPGLCLLSSILTVIFITLPLQSTIDDSDQLIDSNLIYDQTFIPRIAIMIVTIIFILLSSAVYAIECLELKLAVSLRNYSD